MIDNDGGGEIVDTWRKIGEEVKERHVIPKGVGTNNKGRRKKFVEWCIHISWLGSDVQGMDMNGIVILKSLSYTCLISCYPHFESCCEKNYLFF